MSPISGAERERFLHHLVQGDEVAALGCARTLLGAGLEPERILVDLIAPAQVRIGELWHNHRISVAQEHLATAIADRLVTTISQAGSRPAPPRGSVVVACPAGEWHALPARLLAEVLRARGWYVDFLGASVPPDDMSGYLRLRRPDALALSVTLPAYLPQAHRALQTARAAGVPGLVGGCAFGPDGRYARRMAADAWAPDALSAAAVLSHWPPPAPPRAADLVDDGEYQLLVRDRWRLVDSMLEGFRLHLAAQRRDWATRIEETIAELHYLLEYLAAAVYLGDSAIFVDFVAWLRELRSAYDRAPQPVDVALATLADRLAHQPRTRDVLAAGRGRQTITADSGSG
ncbi:cobalamin B12-binding domain-containing protein [Actinoplanes teichomyceticus]|uniref:Methanogenic corrinoid protein MtbC1 n=1 Tax=Actinoplanes teichomyceticus TaxID=1867 RepID=A0A561WBK4_ACTTI|nr:cobalamin-dependent protein [Actinoplanes teichomyceticus]TWG21239.1 methanogenic corrinoid protein MtbC1 [Actinoplanes teichomyceticus]GIF17059.1 cobalamin-binding protein [Actinoplanes teichomyceticus]